MRKKTGAIRAATRSFLPDKPPRRIEMALDGIEMGTRPKISPRFKLDIIERGIIEPPILNFVKGTYYVVAGRRRLHALREAQESGLRDKDEQVPVICFENLSPAQCARLTIGENNQREDNEVADLHALRALENEGLDAAQIAEALHIPVATVKRRKQLGKLVPPILLNGVEAGNISFNLGVRIARLIDEKQYELAAKYQLEGSLTSKDVDAVTDDEKSEEEDEAKDGLFELPSKAIWEVCIKKMSELLGDIKDEDRAKAIQFLDALNGVGFVS